jgi:maleate isomerase
LQLQQRVGNGDRCLRERLRDGGRICPKGLIGVLTPQANTTVEPEFWIMLPPGVAMINARMTSDKSSLEARLVDYFDQMDRAVEQFANAPIGASRSAPRGFLPRRHRARGRGGGGHWPTHRRAVGHGRACRRAGVANAGSARIGLVSPYPEGVTQDLHRLLGGHGLTVDGVVQIATGSINSIRSIRFRPPTQSRGLISCGQKARCHRHARDRHADT